MKCPNCGSYNRPGALICATCKADLYDSLLEKITTKQLVSDETSELVDGKSPTSHPVVIYFSDKDSPVALERRNGLVMGRIEKEGDAVHLDLTDFDGKHLGVSRYHARLDAVSTPPTLTDLGSTNGTHVNGQKIQQDMPHLLRSGDEIRLGRLLFRLYFK